MLELEVCRDFNLSQMNPDDKAQQAWGRYALGPLASLWRTLLCSLPPGKPWRRLALWIRKPLKNTLKPWVDIRVWGLKLRLRGTGNLSEQRLILMPQFLDTEELAAIQSALSEGGTFFDIGANAGGYCLKIASLRRGDIRIEAFEPDPELCDSLRFNLDTNELSSVHLNQIALGRRQGKVTLISGEGNKGQNQVVSGEANGVSVEMTTLPHFMEQNGIKTINALKIDIEGYECDALEPLFSEMPTTAWPQLLICEVVHDESNQLAALLERTGYKLVKSGRLNGIYRLQA